MYQTGEYVVYENNGICEIKGITMLKDAGMPDRMYYMMVPLHDKEARLYVAVDSKVNRLRRVLTKDEAEALIREIPQMDELAIENEKLREKRYQEIIRGSDCRELAKVIKTLYYRRRKRISEGKKNTATDEKYFKIAEKNLFEELAFAIGSEPNLISELIAREDKAASEAKAHSCL